jgi:hypothetical protein
MGIEHNIDIHRSVDKVFAFVSNPANLPQYEDNIVDVKQITPEKTGVGTIYQLFAVQFGRKMTVDLEISAYKPNDNYAIRVTGGSFPVETHYSFVSQDNTTVVIGKRTPLPSGIWKVLLALISIPARKKLMSELNNLKVYLEKGP